MSTTPDYAKLRAKAEMAVLEEGSAFEESRAAFSEFHRAASPGLIISLLAEVARLSTENAALREDAARLDWLDTQSFDAIEPGTNATEYRQWDVQGQCLTVRGAIDFARSSQESAAASRELLCMECYEMVRVKDADMAGEVRCASGHVLMEALPRAAASPSPEPGE